MKAKANTAKKADEPAQDALSRELSGFFDSLQSDRLTFFPIRHHSPACAWHACRWIREFRPDIILIEGPAALNRWVPELVKAELRPPVAVYMTWTDREKKLSVAKAGEIETGPHSYTAYYPLCDYSPELVALREGHAIGAETRFIDLSYPEQLLADGSRHESPDNWRSFSLLAEAHLNSSNYVRQLARRAGCRDHDELWDHLFEIHASKITTAQFILNAAAYCYMARRDYDEASLEFDGTLARERAMAAEISRTVRKGQARIMVVTGGFHTANLLRLIASDGENPGPRTMRDESENYLVRYSFDQLDALNGYASGMRSPRYYDLVWSRMRSEHSDPYSETATDLLVEIGRSTRHDKTPYAVSAADEIVALENARLLALLRGHSAPAREDLLDAIRSCFVKGSMDSEGALLMATVQRAFCGDAIGQIPAGLPLPPIVADFHQTARSLGLNLESTTPRRAVLEIYRRPKHQSASRLMHCLDFLAIPFARALSGPDFATGAGLNYINETWEYAWSPGTDGALLQASVLGSTVQEAASRRLTELMHALEQEGQGRNASMAVGFLLRALQMGLYRQTERILAFVSTQLAEDNNFVSVVDALRQIILVLTAREPLGATRLDGLPGQAEVAYRKACYLVQELGSVPADAARQAVNGLCVLGEIVETAASGTFAPDPDLFYCSLAIVAGQPQGSPGVIGAAMGLRYRGNCTGEAELQATLLGFLNAATLKNAEKTQFIQGLLQACRELSWRSEWFLRALDGLWKTWDDEEFMQHLPHLRLAFALLTPAETDHAAGAVARLYEADDLGDLVMRDLSEADVQRNLALTELVKQTLQADGLGAESVLGGKAEGNE